MQDKIESWKAHVRVAAANPSFIHHEWFVKWHLEIVERIALELCEKYPAADGELVQVMVWLHDYGKALVGPTASSTFRAKQSAPHSAVSPIRLHSCAPVSSQTAQLAVDPNISADEYAMTLSAGRAKLTEMGFTRDFVERAVSGIETMDKKMELDLHEAPLEVQIVASADGCSHMVGPFLSLYWREHPELSTEELLAANLAKLEKDWNRKIILPEARAAFAVRHDFLVAQSGELHAADGRLLG
jgi:hypothetical protein